MKYLNWILEIAFQCIIFIFHVQSEISNAVIPPKTNFSCLNKTAGFYADTGANCKIYYTCDEYGNKFTYHCPEETAFRQDALICDHAHLVHCNGHPPYNTKYIEEGKSTNSSYTKDTVDKNYFVSHATQSPKTNSKVRYEFTFNAKRFPSNFNKTEASEHNTMNIRLMSGISPTTSSLNPFSKTRFPHVSFINNTQRSELIKDENLSVQKQVFNNRDKFNEKDRINQKGHLDSKSNDAVHNFMKSSSNVFSTNARNQEDNGKNDPTTRGTEYSLSFANHRNYPYLETLKSIQKSTEMFVTRTNITTVPASVMTTELPVYALTLSLKPLVPSELEYDPYYPNFSTSTESYYTPAHSKEWSYMKNSTHTTWSNVHFDLPPILPDLNSLEDIVDRRKLLYIPRIKSN